MPFPINAHTEHGSPVSFEPPKLLYFIVFFAFFVIYGYCPKVSVRPQLQNSTHLAQRGLEKRL